MKVVTMSLKKQQDNLCNTHILSEYRDLLSVQDLSCIFQASKHTIYKEIKDGKFGTPIRIGRAIKIPKIRILQKFFNE